MTLEDISPIEIQAGRENNPDLWTKSVLALEERYQANPNEAETILRLGHLYWYLILEEGVYNCHLDCRMMEKDLLNLYEHAKVVLKSNVEFLWSFAWMMGISGHYFEPNMAIDFGWAAEKQLIWSMYQHAAELEPNNPFPIWAGWGRGLFKDLDPAIMLEHCKQGIIRINIGKVFENRGHWGTYFYDGVMSMIQTYLGYTDEEHMPAAQAYIQQVIAENT